VFPVLTFVLEEREAGHVVRIVSRGGGVGFRHVEKNTDADAWVAGRGDSLDL